MNLINFGFSRTKATVMISILVIGYIVFWTPFHAYALFHAVGDFLNHKQCESLRSIQST
jgi:hypothetical protein